MGEPVRTLEFRKDGTQERELERMNVLLAPLEEQMVASFGQPQLPLLFIVGVPRSGSTLLAQVLASTGAFSYVSNFVARFWMAPFLGMTIQSALGIGANPDQSFASSYGVTKDWSGPHEFGYFWSRWFRGIETNKLDPENLAKIDRTTLARELAAMEHVGGKPLFFKNLMCGLQMTFLAELLEKPVFVLCRRDPLFNAQSLLVGREEIYGNRETWWSLKPKEYNDLVELSPWDQVAAQQHYILSDIAGSAGALPDSQFLEILYEDLCLQPRTEVGRIREALLNLGTSIDWRLGSVPDRFELRNSQRLEDEDFKKLREAVEQWPG